MSKISARFNVPDDTYGRTLESLEVNAMASLHEFLTDMDEVMLVAIGRQGDDIKIMQINADQGVTAPPPDVPSRIRRMTIKPINDLAQDIYSDLINAFDIQCEMIVGTDDDGYSQGQIHLGNFEDRRTIKVVE